MMKQATHHGLVSLLILVLPFAAGAQVPVDDEGNVIAGYETGPGPSSADERTTGNDDIPLLAPAELEELVGPIALYPDDLLAIVLPASAYPLQIIEAARFLEELEEDPSVKPDPDWDDAVVALLNYPEVVTLMNDEIDWTWRLGEAVVAQQADVVSAIEAFRDRAYAAGNLRSDDYQTVSRDDGVIEITPVADDVIYVPYYEPERVVVYQPRPVYYYYPRAYPVYYYPYPSSYVFNRGFFWGVTTAFTIGWVTDSLHVYHHSYYGHPYYGHSYWDYWWYRRPSIHLYNTAYRRNTRVTVNHYYTGDRWQPRHEYRRPIRPTQPRVMNRHYYGSDNDGRARHSRNAPVREPIQFRDRGAERDRALSNRSGRASRDNVARQVRESRERISRQQRDRREPMIGASRESREAGRTVNRSRPRQDARHTTQDRVQRESSQVSPSPQLRREARASRESQPVAKRQARRESRPTPQRPSVRREPQAARQGPARANVRPAPQREVRRESRPAPQREVRRESRPAPQREVRRESRPAPQREVRRESRPAPQRSESRREAAAQNKERREKRRSER